MAYSLSNICTKNYTNRTTTVKIIVGGSVAYFFHTQCSTSSHGKSYSIMKTCNTCYVNIQINSYINHLAMAMGLSLTLSLEFVLLK